MIGAKTMSVVKPFQGWRPTPDKVNEVASPPYDVLSSEEAREKAQNLPYSFLHVVKPEIDLDPLIDPHDPRVYQKGAENLQILMKEKILIQDEKPCLYIYKLKVEDHIQIGLVALVSVEEYNQNKIKKHEHTRPDKEQDRVTHIDYLNTQTGPVFLMYRSQEKINQLIEKAMHVQPVYDFISDYDVQHTFFVVDDEELIQKIVNAFALIDKLYIADGHHRSASASRVQKQRMGQNPNHTGKEEYNYFLAVLFADSQLRILDYNRVVKDLNGLSVDTFLTRVEENFTIKDSQLPIQKPKKPLTFNMYLNSQWYTLEARKNSIDLSDTIDCLDISVLQNNLLSPILGILDPRTDKRIHFVGGIRGLKELEKLVNEGSYQVAFALHPTTISQLMAVADAGKVMPPKSTWFEPKLRSGMVVHTLY